MNTLAFVICVEKGELEGQAELLCRSIRKFGGPYRDASIHTFQPRRGTTVSRRTRSSLEGLGVVHHTETLNVSYHHYPIGNKIFASAYAEEILRDDVLVFLDTDTVIIGAPFDLNLPPEVDAAARPCNRWEGGKSSTGPQDAKDIYWQMMYEVTGINREPFVQTVIDQKKVRAYFSAGLVAARRSAGLFHQWKSDFLLLMETGHHPGAKLSGLAHPTEATSPHPAKGIRNMDELSLAITLGRVFDKVQILSGRYNYLLYRRSILPPPLNRAQLDELVHIHYRFWFKKPGYLNKIRPPFDPHSRILTWLNRYLPLQPASPNPQYGGPILA